MSLITGTRGQQLSRLIARKISGYKSNICPSVHKHKLSHGSAVSKNGLLQVSQEVEDAMHSGKPVVALESTIITHGMPYPDNVSTAKAVEDIIRQNGSVPATVAVIKGQVHVGLTSSELEWLGSRDGLVKTSRRDFPVVLSQGQSGGTTVSGTMLVAHKMGIPIFVTGGIGGVHRGAETSMDISADLTELGCTPVTVLVHGHQSIPIGRTLEYLETQGVCVATFGSSRDFPAFFTSKSGFQSPYNVQTATSAAGLIESNLQLNTGSGILIAVPIPESFAASGEIIESAIQQAISEAGDQGICGKDVTPFILSRVNVLTKGISLQANIALIKNNAEVGSKIASALNDMQLRGDNSKTSILRPQHEESGKEKQSRPVVVGGVVVDFYAQLGQKRVQSNGATYPGSLRQSFGGVGRNIADCLSHLGSRPLLVSAVGRGSHTGALHDNCQHMDLSGVKELEGRSTAVYCGVLQQCGEMMFGVGDMEIMSHITPHMVSQYRESLSQAPLVCVDGNIPAETIEYICDICSQNKVPVWFEPADIHKALKPYSTSARDHMTYTSPNVAELMQMWAAFRGKTPADVETISLDTSSVDDVIDACLPYCCDLADSIPVVMVTLGCHGVLLCHRLGDKPVFPTKHKQTYSDDVSVLHYPACSPAQMPSTTVSVSGAGDCFAAGVIDAIVKGHDLDLCIKAGLMAAQYSLQSHHAVPTTILPEAFSSDRVEKWAPWKPRLIKLGSENKMRY
ncbi:pseudouridine-metabolizing bifunctional protein C1861.05-like [Haliotis rubra]|uniref:pseudouridine-metabolizing bifunctional protein C1861.05-like n=1 Tax=Haliotis rubra TaxID=36100 RepID=UPI001EE53868|nr:pseudouridine-metabolizing bifunctional protein C1861.05-like [Haliotis rubra]